MKFDKYILENLEGPNSTVMILLVFVCVCGGGGGGLGMGVVED